MLKKEPYERINEYQALNHPWIISLKTVSQSNWINFKKLETIKEDDKEPINTSTEINPISDYNGNQLCFYEVRGSVQGKQ